MKKFFSHLADLIFPCSCTLCSTPTQHGSSLCEECIAELPYQNDYHIFSYTFPIDRLITDMKFNGRLSYARFFGQSIAKKIMALPTIERPDLLIPVPLHRRRLFERGFNQALEIAKTISKETKIPINFKSIRRIKHTTAQSSLPAHQRKNNIKNAFKLLRPIKGNHIAIIDDVMTTGSTLMELKAVLEKKGYSRISVYTAAKA